MTAVDTVVPTQDERVMAAISHAAALVPMMGVIAPIIIWVTQKNTSRFVAFQSLQAIAYQLCMIVAWFIGMACYFLSFIGVFAFTAVEGTVGSGKSADLLTGMAVFGPLLVGGAMVVGGFLFIAYAVIAAVLTLQGKPFRYLIIGRAVERFMQPA
jgi:uncharacterized Tic20 family protein